jgi:hypothetical protein
MKKSSILILTMLALTSVMAITVWAANPHFLSCSASGVNSDGTLNACFKIAGLGDNQTLAVTASATADAVYGCLNHGKQCPNAANKISVQGNVSATGTFTSGKNGQITACLTVNPPAPPSTFSCPNGQDLVLVSVSYTNVQVSAPGAGDCVTSPASFSANFFPQCP